MEAGKPNKYRTPELENTELSILRNLLPASKYTDVNDPQEENELLPMYVTEAGIIILGRTQDLNAFTPILVMEAGKFITRNPDEENTSLSILLISLCDSNDTEVREAQLANEPLVNRVTT